MSFVEEEEKFLNEGFFCVLRCGLERSARAIITFERPVQSDSMCVCCECE